jgi:hypothetical protein
LEQTEHQKNHGSGETTNNNQPSEEPRKPVSAHCFVLERLTLELSGSSNREAIGQSA